MATRKPKRSRKPEQSDKPTPSRRRVERIVTEGSIEKVRHEVNRVLSVVDRESPPPANDAGRAQRQEILSDAANKAMLGALAYLKERHQDAFRALLTGAQYYAHGRIHGVDALYVPRRLGR